VDRSLLASDRDVEARKISLLFGAPEALIGSEKWSSCCWDHHRAGGL